METIKSNGKFELTASLKLLKKYFFVISMALIYLGCTEQKVEEINIGYIGPLSIRATDLGIGPANALKLAVQEYNVKREFNEPKVNLYIEDDKWEMERALPAYQKLKREHNIKVLFISNTDGAIALSDSILKDRVIMVNPINNDKRLSSLNQNIFEIAKDTEEANGIIALRIIELGLKKVIILKYPNDFMNLAAKACERMLNEAGIEYKTLTVDKNKTDFRDELKSFKDTGFDAYVFFGYKEFGYAMKQARDLGIKAPFFGSTVLLDPSYYDNSEGAIKGTEFTFFTKVDGNYVLANEFLKSYKSHYGELPSSVWPPMQAYDAMNLVLNKIKDVNIAKKRRIEFDAWLREKIASEKYFQGVCGNISITEGGSSRGIYFSLYRFESENEIIKVRH